MEALSGGCEMKKLACGVVVLLTLVGIAGMMTRAMGQEVTAAIVGTVTDPSGCSDQRRQRQGNGTGARHRVECGNE